MIVTGSVVSPSCMRLLRHYREDHHSWKGSKDNNNDNNNGSCEDKWRSKLTLSFKRCKKALSFEQNTVLWRLGLVFGAYSQIQPVICFQNSLNLIRSKPLYPAKETPLEREKLKHVIGVFIICVKKTRAHQWVLVFYVPISKVEVCSIL